MKINYKTFHGGKYYVIATVQYNGACYLMKRILFFSDTLIGIDMYMCNKLDYDLLGN